MVVLRVVLLVRDTLSAGNYHHLSFTNTATQKVDLEQAKHDDCGPAFKLSALGSTVRQGLRF